MVQKCLYANHVRILHQLDLELMKWMSLIDRFQTEVENACIGNLPKALINRKNKWANFLTMGSLFI